MDNSPFGSVNVNKEFILHLSRHVSSNIITISDKIDARINLIYSPCLYAGFCSFLGSICVYKIVL